MPYELDDNGKLVRTASKGPAAPAQLQNTMGVDLAKYENYLAPGESYIKGEYDQQKWDDNRARNQSGTEKALNSIGQGVGTFGTALASGVGALVSGAAALGAEAITGGEAEGMDIFINNPFMKGIDNFDKYLKEDLIPTYYTKEQQESLLSASTGTDLLNGLGFMASAFVPNAAIGKLFGNWAKMASVAKAGKLPAVLAAAEEAGTLTNMERRLLSSFGTHLDKAGPIVGGVVGRIGESSMEAYQTYNQIKESLTAERDQAQQEIEMTGQATNPSALLSDEEIENRAKDGRNNVFGGNMALAVSDIAQYTRWFRGGGLGERLTKEGLKTVIKTKTKGEILGGLLKESAQEAGEEGFQFLLSKGAEKSAKGKSFLEGIGEASGDLFTTVEGQKSMLLGAILGGGMSSIAEAKNSKKTKETLNAMAAELTSTGDASQRYITDPTTGKKIVNPELTKIATTFAFYEKQKDDALDQGDQDAYDIAEKMQFSHLVEAKMKAGQFDDFINELQDMGSTNPEEIKAMFGELPIKNGKEMSPSEVAFDKIQLAKRVKQMTEGLQNLPGMEKLGANGMDMTKHMLFTQESLRDQVKLKDEKIAEIQSRAVYNPFPVENAELFEQEDSLLPQDKQELQKTIIEKDIILGKYKEISDVFKEIVAKPEVAQKKADDAQEAAISNAVDTLVTDLQKENDTLSEVAGQTVTINGVQYTVATDPFSQDEIKLDYSPQFKKSEEDQRAKKQEELEEAFNEGNTLNESSVGQKVKYKGQMYYLTKDAVEDTFQLENIETGQVTDIQKDEELGYDAPLYYFGIEEVNENPITDLIEISTVGENQVITIDGKAYLNLYSNPLSAINYDAEGNIVSVSLNANNKKQSSRTFKKYAEEIAYAILLDTYNKLNNENQEAKRNFAEKLKNADVKNDTERKESTVNERDTEETEKIEEELSQKEEEAFTAQKELEDFNTLLEIALSAETSEELLSYKAELESNKYYNKTAIDQLNDRFRELIFNETNKDVTEGTVISKEDLLNEVTEKEIPEGELPETDEDIFTTDEEVSEDKKLTRYVRKSTIDSTTGSALMSKDGEMVVEDGERVQQPAFMAQTVKFNDQTISNNVVKEKGDTPNKITFKAEKGTITEDVLKATNRSRLNDGFAPLTMEQFENDPNYFPIVLTLIVNGKEDTSIKSYYHNPEYYEKTVAWLTVENNPDLDEQGKISKHNANIKAIKKTRANLVDRIKNQGSVTLAVASKSKGVLNYNPKIKNQGIKTSNVIGILASSFEELIDGLTNEFYSGGMPINTSGIKVVTSVTNAEGNKYTINTQSNSGTSSFESTTPYPIGAILFELIAPNGEVVSTAPFSKRKFSDNQIDALTDLILLRLQGEKTIDVDGTLITIAGSEAIPGILDSVMYIGAAKSREDAAQDAQLFFTKDGQIQLGKIKYPANTEGIDVLIKNHLNNYKSKPHFKFKSVEIFGKNFDIPVRQSNGTFKIENPSSYMEFLFGGEDPLISTTLNKTKFVNTYFTFAKDSQGNLISTKESVKPSEPIITPEAVSNIKGTLSAQGTSIELEVIGETGKEFLLTVDRKGNISLFSEKQPSGSYKSGEPASKEAVDKLYNKYVPEKTKTAINNWLKSFTGSWAASETQDGKNYEKAEKELNAELAALEGKTKEVVKEAIPEAVISQLFESTPELVKIGTSDQYAQYLNTIFPDSKVKNIVYHGTDFDKDSIDFKTDRNGIFLASTPIYASYFSKEDNAFPALVNFKNSYQAKQLTDNIGKDEITEIKSKGYDSVIGKGGISKMEQHQNDLEFIAFDPTQVHILGSSKDIEGFKQFVKPVTEEAIPEEVIPSVVPQKENECSTLVAPKTKEFAPADNNISNYVDTGEWL